MIKIRLREMLEDRGWPQSELVRRTGLNLSSISRMCGGKVMMINLNRLDRICEALSCDVMDILRHIKSVE